MLTNKDYLKSLLNDKCMMEDMIYKVEKHGGTMKSKQWGISSETIKDTISARDLETIATRPYTEAIIVEYGRPALLVQNDDFVIAESDEWNNRLKPTRTLIRKAIRSTGRIELIGHPDFPWIGTGWQIAEDIIVTNRHVAIEFSAKKANGFIFKMNPEGETIQARIDYREEYLQSKRPLEFEIDKILYITEISDNVPDVAFLKLKNPSNLPDPIPLKIKKISKDEYICVIGYPARDSHRNDENVMEKIFGDIYNVKRLQPGQITNYPANSNKFIFFHDCSTLGGNSGSVVIDINSGEALGLHFGGRFKQNNYAVKSQTLLDLLKKTKTTVSLANSHQNYNVVQEAVSKIKTRDPNTLGYNSKHLGNNFEILPPTLKQHIKSDDVVIVNNKLSGEKKYYLNYTHFATAISKSRRMPIFSICNIDGNNWYHVLRGGETWYYDDRVDKKYQIGNELYKNNDLDRGHMTRREDPTWGSKTIADQANDDTFHYTNACPQHKELNQNKSTWQGLENYILDNAKTYELKVTVFTGPVFGERDMIYRGEKIPNEFWKIVITLLPNKKISATAYLLSQKDLLRGLEEKVDFKYGQYKTFQIPVKEIEKRTNLSFNGLDRYDPLNNIHEGFNLLEVGDYNDIKLS